MPRRSAAIRPILSDGLRGPWRAAPGRGYAAGGPYRARPQSSESGLVARDEVEDGGEWQGPSLALPSLPLASDAEAERECRPHERHADAHDVLRAAGRASG